MTIITALDWCNRSGANKAHNVQQHQNVNSNGVLFNHKYVSTSLSCVCVCVLCMAKRERLYALAPKWWFQIGNLTNHFSQTKFAYKVELII